MSGSEKPWRFVRVAELGGSPVRVKVIDQVIGLFHDETRRYAAYEASGTEDDVGVYEKRNDSTYLREALGIETSEEKAAREALYAKRMAVYDAEEVERCRRRVAEYDAKQAALRAAVQP